MTKQVKKAPRKPKGRKSPSRGKDPGIPKPGAGRRTTLTQKIQDCLVENIKDGNYYTTACGYCQVPESTFYLWMKRGEEELERIIEAQKKTGKPVEPSRREGIFLEFVETIKNASAIAEVTAVKKVLQDKDWKAHMTWLERRFADRWKRKDHHELTGPDGKDLVPVVIYIPDNGRDKKK